MDAHDLRGMAQRCRERYRVAVNPEIKAQLLEWIDDFENEAAAAEKTQPGAAVARDGNR